MPLLWGESVAPWYRVPAPFLPQVPGVVAALKGQIQVNAAPPQTLIQLFPILC